MRRLPVVFLLLFAISVAQTPVVHPVYPTGTGSPLGQQIAALLADPGVARAHWGIAVTAMDGTPLYGLDEGKFFRPASNAKLFTTAAAMALLGGDRQFTTSVVGRGPVKGGVLRGELVLRGGGDANFAGGYALPWLPKAQRTARAKGDGLADFDALAAQVRAAGVRVVEGDVVGDDTRFEDVPYPAGWAIEDMLWGYGAPVSALTVHDNQLDLTITDTVGSERTAKATIVLEPQVTFYTVNDASADRATANPAQERRQRAAVYNQQLGSNWVSIDRVPAQRNFSMMGDVSATYGPYKDELAIDQPAEFAAAAMKQALERAGIVVKGSARGQHHGAGSIGSFLKAAHITPPYAEMYKAMGKPGQLFTPQFNSTCQAQRTIVPGEVEVEERKLAERVSVPLAEDLKLTLKESQNLHAEILLRNLGVETDCVSGSLLSSALAWERAYLTTKAGLDGGDFEFYDGSGLSMKDLVTPRATAQLLVFATTQPWFATWKEALPVGGMDGTAGGRFAQAPLKGHVFAKTGTLGESRALSGYVDCASGRQVVFSVMVDDHAPSGSNDRAVMDAIVAAIAANH